MSTTNVASKSKARFFFGVVFLEADRALGLTFFELGLLGLTFFELGLLGLTFFGLGLLGLFFFGLGLRGLAAGAAASTGS